MGVVSHRGAARRVDRDEVQSYIAASSDHVSAAPRRATQQANTMSDSWATLNDRQCAYLCAPYDCDQAKEAERRQRAARGDWFARTPASEWRWQMYGPVAPPSALYTAQRPPSRPWHRRDVVSAGHAPARTMSLGALCVQLAAADGSDHAGGS